MLITLGSNPPSPPHVLGFQGLQGDFDFQSINLSTRLTLSLRPGDQAANGANIYASFRQGVHYRRDGARLPAHSLRRPTSGPLAVAAASVLSGFVAVLRRFL